jgi:hypothetical protein
VKKKRSLNKINRILYSSNNELKVIKKFFHDLSAEEIYACLPKVINHRYFSSLPIVNSGNINTNFLRFMIPKTDKLKSLHAILAIIKAKAPEINEFSKMESELLSCILFSNYDKAHMIADEIKSAHGFSMWWVSIKSALYDLEKNATKKQEFIQDVISTTENGSSYLKFIVKKIADRYDDAGFFYEKDESIRQLFKGLPSNIYEHIIFRLSSFDYSRKYDYQSILDYEKNVSFIDAFKAIHILTIDCLYKNTEDDKIIIQVIHDSLRGVVENELIDIILLSESSKSQVMQGDIQNDLYANYIAGNYHHICSMVDDKPYLIKEFGAFLIFVKSSVRCEHVSNFGFVSQISERLSDVLLRNKNHISSLDFLYSISLAFGDFKWFKELYILLRKESISDDNHKRLSDLNQAISSTKTPFKMVTNSGSSESDMIPPNFVGDCHDNTYKNIVAQESNFVFDEDRLKKYRAKYYFNNEQYESVVKQLEGNVASADILTGHELSKLLYDSYIKIGEIEKAAEFCGRKVIENRNLLSLFNTNLLCDIIKNNITKLSSIYVPIVLSIHTRFVNNLFIPVSRFSLENFLDKVGASSAEELINKKDLFDEDSFCYFLEFVFIPDNMKLCLYFEDQEHIQSERLKVCKYLLSIYPKSDTLLDEVKDIAKAQVLSIASKQVDSSRIYSDTTKIKSSLTGVVNELYDKFIKIKLNDYSSTEDEKNISTIINKLKDDEEITDLHRALCIMYVPNLVLNEKNDLFIKLLSKVRDEFVYGVNGLNTNLSTRIRHGLFPTTIRKAFVQESLITNQSSNNSNYNKNNYWLDKLLEGNENKLERVGAIFSDFSKDVESVIKEVNDEWFQIKILGPEFKEIVSGDYKSSALFDFSLSPFEAYYFQMYEASFISYQDFIRTVVDWLWRKTDYSLENVRKKIENDLRDKLITLTRDFQTSVNVEIHDHDVRVEFNDAINRSREALEYNLTAVTSWFKKSDIRLIEDFDFETVIQIVKRTVEVQVNNNVNLTNRFIGKTLSPFVDIFYILLENAHSKSNLRQEDIVVQIDCFVDENNCFIFEISNNCYPVSCLNLANSKLDAYRVEYDALTEFIDKAQVEGNSGFIKIGKIITQDLALKHTCEFGYNLNDQFKVKLTFSDMDKVFIK